MTTFDLSPIGGELFAGRDTRRALVPTDAFQKLTRLETEMKAPGFAEMQLDRHASALWLSGKLQRPAQEVLSNFDAYARAYWGKDVTPGQAYDRIVEYERTAMQMAATAPQAGAKDGAKSEQATPDANAGKSWQFLRAATGGFAKAGHDTAGGTLALVEGALNTLGGMPDRKGVSEDPDFADALFKLGVMEYDGTLDTPEGAMVKARVDAGRARLDEDFKARMEEYRATIRGGLAADVRAGADFFYELGNESAQFYGVSEEYRASTIGKVAEAGGSMVASSALLAAGSLGFLGKVKGAAQVAKRLADVAGAGQIYAGVEQDRMAVEGDAYRNAGWAFASNLANAGVQQVIERVPILDNTLERALKHVPHKGGVVKLGDVLREMRKEAIRSGFVEAGEEVIQGAWDDFIVDMSYDDTRVDLSDGKGDYLKRRVGEAVAGFGGGVMLGGTFGGAAIFDRNQAAKKAERAFASRAGEMLTPEDLAHLRRARTDEQIKAMPWGETLLAAANGDAKAAEAYNRAVFDASFVRTDGLAAFGDEVGEYKGMPAVRLSDGRRVPIDMADPEQVARFNAFRRQVAAAASGDAAVAEFQRRFGEGLTTERPAQASSLEEMVKAGTLTQEQAEDAKAIAVAMKKVAADAPLSALFPEGSARAVEDSKTRLVRMVTSVLQGKNAAVAIEETAEAWIQAAVLKGDVDRGELRTLRMDWQQANGETPAEGASEARADVEWFSRRVIEYALAGKVTEVTGSKWWRWIRTLGEQLRDVLKGAQKMRAALKDGTLDPRLEGWFKAALGIEKLGERISPERAQRQADLEATFAELPPESVQRFQEAEQRLRDYELLKADYRRQELETARNSDEAIAAGLQDRMRALDFERAKAEEAIDKALDLPASVQLSPQAQAMLDEWETFSLSQVNPDSLLPGAGSFSLAQTNTPEFKRWFGESKVVDAEGKPRVMYHGTSADVDFVAFDEAKMDPKALFGPGIYTTANSAIAGGTDGETKGYAGKGDGQSSRVLPLFVKVEKPFDADEFPGSPMDVAEEMDRVASKLFDEATYLGIDFDLIDRMETNQNVDNGSLFLVLARAFSKDKKANAQRVLREMGHDGIIHTGGLSAKWNPDVKTPHVVAIAFKPEQVKSAIGNRGTFDPANPDITFSLAQTNTPEFKRWFGKSKVVDEAGKPLAVYRGEWGGDPGQNSFANTQLGLPTFTDAKALAEVYANDGEGGRVREAFLSIQKPLRFGESDGVVNKAEFKRLAKLLKLTAEESADLVSAGGWVVDGEPQSFDNIGEVPAGAYVEAPTLADTAFIQERAKALGFDGMIIRGIFTADVDPVGSFDGVTALEFRPFDVAQVREAGVENKKRGNGGDTNPGWTPEMLADFERKRAAAAASSSLSSLRVEGGIGIVTSTGEVRVSPFKSAADLMEKTHAKVFGDIGGADRFRYDAQTNSLVWTAEPSLESREAALNYLMRRAAFVETEETDTGKKLPPLFGGTFSLKQGEFPGMDGGRSPGENQGELPLEYHAARRKIEDTWEKWMASQGYAELVRMRDETYVASLVTARAKHDSASMAGLESVISPVYEAIRRAGAPEVSAALVRNTQQAAQRKERDRRVVRALAEKMQRLDESVAFAFDAARLNGDLANMQSIADRYGFRAELDGVLAMFDRIRQEALVAGVPIGTFWEKPEEVADGVKAKLKEAGRNGAAIERVLKEAGYRLRIETYWPRHVIDYDAYLSYLSGTKPGSSELARAYAAALAKAQGRPLTADELDLVASKGVAELKRRAVQGGGKPSALKRRKIEEVALEAVRFYKKPIDSAYSHVERMHDYVAMMSFFGDKARVDDPAVDGALPVLNVKETLEHYLETRREQLTAAQVEAIRAALQARFTYVGSPSIINTVKTLGYLQGMTQLYTPLTAVFPDMWSIALESNANLSTFVSAIYQAATGESAADLSSFGLIAREMHREFQTQMGGRLARYAADKLKLKGKTRATVEAITLANTLDGILRVLGLNKFNDFVQRSRANAELIALRKAAAAGNLSRIQQSRIERFFLPAERKQLLADVAAGKGVEESYLVASYVWAGLADYMPISLDQMPEQYLKNPKGRIFYMYKTFLVMQTAAIRRESIDAIVDGVKKKDPKLVAYGVGTLLAMVSLLLAFSMPPDMVRAYLQNRPYVLEDELTWKLMGLAGVSHFVAQKVRQDATGAAAAYFAPPTSIIPDAIRDAQDLWDGKLTGDVDGFDFSKLRVWNYTPIIGRTYQGWFGSDSEKRQKELEASEWFQLRADPTKKEASEAARRRWLLERYGQE